MRPAEISPDAVIAAGKQLLAENRNVTAFALREAVGGGNAQRLRQIWSAHLAASSESDSAPAELPLELAGVLEKASGEQTAILKRLAAELNAAAVRAAERRVADLAASAEEARAVADKEMADASAAVDALEQRLEEILVAKGQLEADLAQERERLQSALVDLAKVSEQADGYRVQAAGLVDQLTAANANALEAANLQGRNDLLTEQNAELRAIVESLKAQLK
ncbi:DNA-binding protein [Stenotrophomonas maltophilia]